ncbi:hypothetical protein [Nocardioides mangrovi]|uniref:Preprotein translocase n=1 Tax=Nocardioides mangrovi TaxID=2874580 RepID=A0ABS7UC90_9ACTN|nr:hypothetical protein [Nocardioides mangrovi]MBZ5738618.1 hypothetical protein [Nocardioides mangrovi]
MFGLTFEKLFLVAIIAGVVIGPQRLPVYAAKLAETIRALRGFVEDSRTRAETELGVTRAEWESLDLRQYDPRRVVRDALREPPAAAATDPEPEPDEEADAPLDAALLAEASRVRPGQQYVVTGSAAHPRRVRIDALPADDPRRVAAQMP